MRGYIPGNPPNRNTFVSSAVLSRRTTVMVVDDEPVVRTLCRRILEDAGYQVCEAANGMEALTLLPNRDPSAVVTDLRMPRMDGLTLATHLAGLSPPIPIRFISGFGQQHDPVSALGPVLRKPFSGEQLVAGVRDVLTHHAQSA
jgi:CheY-like chemotaxis protein